MTEAMSTVTFRLTAAEKKELTEFTESMGFELPALLKTIAKQMLITRRIPLQTSEYEYHNDETLQAIEEARKQAYDSDAKTFDTAEEMFEDILG